MSGTAEGLTSGDHLHSLLWASRRAGEPSAWHGHVAFMHWLVDALRPRCAVELGTERGISFAALCHAVAALGIPTPCFAVDTWQGDAHTGHYDDSVFNSLDTFNKQYYGHFATLLRCTFDEALPRFEPGSVDLLHIDGLHTYEAVRHDYETWLPTVSSRGVVLFHDIAVRQHDFGVWQLWEEISGNAPSFAFEHSAGLGVLAVGPDVPDAVRALCSLQGEEAARARASFSAFSDVALTNGRRDLYVAALEGRVASMQGMLRGFADQLAQAAA